MKYSKFKTKGLFLLLTTFLVIPSVHAYLDPGTGSLILQIIGGAIVTALFSIKIYWKKIKGKFSNVFSSNKKNEDSEKRIIFK